MRVLVAIDGSEQAAVAIDLVAGVAWPAGTEILVAEAVESGAGLSGGQSTSSGLILPKRRRGELEHGRQDHGDEKDH